MIEIADRMVQLAVACRTYLDNYDKVTRWEETKEAVGFLEDAIEAFKNAQKPPDLGISVSETVGVKDKVG